MSSEPPESEQADTALIWEVTKILAIWEKSDALASELATSLVALIRARLGIEKLLNQGVAEIE
jgi:hypothetical protein